MKKLAISVVLALPPLVPSVAFAQQAPVGQIKSLSHAIHAMDDLDTTLAFYRDVFGIDGKAQDFANSAVPLLTNATASRCVCRWWGCLAARGSSSLILKASSASLGSAQYTDPGAASLVLYVRRASTRWWPQPRRRTR